MHCESSDIDIKDEASHELRVDWSVIVLNFGNIPVKQLFDCHIFNADTTTYVNTPIER